MAGKRLITALKTESHPASTMQQGVFCQNLATPHSARSQPARQPLENAVNSQAPDLRIFDAARPRRRVTELNDKKIDGTQARGVHELFETQVERTPYAVALVYSKGEVSYRELDNQANRVALHLRSLAFGPDDYALSPPTRAPR